MTDNSHKALAGRQGLPGCGNARPLEHPDIQGIAQRWRDQTRAGGVQQAGKACGQHALGRRQGTDGAVFQIGVKIHFLFRTGIAVRQVGVQIAQSRHDQVAAVINHHVIRTGSGQGGCGIKAHNTAIFDHQCVIMAVGGLRAGKDTPAFQNGSHAEYPVARSRRESAASTSPARSDMMA